MKPHSKPSKRAAAQSTPARLAAEVTQRVFSRLLFWAPVWLPLVLVYQLALGGWKPVRAEALRLERAADEVQARVDALADARTELEARRAMLADPVYRERVARTLHAADREPMTLDEARALSKR